MNGSQTRPEPARLLAKAGGDDGSGYTRFPSKALSAEPEAIPEEDQRAISLKARADFADVRRVENERRDRKAWQDRFRKVEMRAADKRVDVFRQVSAIRREIMAMEKLVEEAG